MRGRIGLLAVILIAALLAGRAAAGAYADGLWYAALGADPLWRDRLAYVLLARGGSWLLFGGFVFLNLYVVRRSVVALVLPRRLANVEIPEEVPGRHLVIAALLIAILFGWLLALPAEAWRQLALAQHGIPFGETDPYFEADLGFFVYWLPLEGTLFVATLTTVLTTTLLVVFFYALTPSLRWERGHLHVSQYARRHVVALLAALLLVLAWSFRLDEYGLLLAGSGADGVMTFSDHHALIPTSGWLALFAIGGAFMLLVLGWVGQMRAATLVLFALFTAGLGIRGVWPLVLRWSASSADVAQRDLPYKSSRAKYSRRAFAVDQILVADTGERFATPAAAAMSLSSWDPAMILRAVSRRSHATATAIGWSANGGTLLALVPIRAEPAPGDSTPPRWPIVRALPAGADASGELVMLPPSGEPAAPAAGVLVYDGAPARLLVIADTADLLPAPSLATAGARLALGWSHERLGVMSADLPGPHPKAIVRRDLRARLSALAPFFEQGTLAVPAVVGDSLFWIIDLYAASQSYPLSRRDSLGDDEFSYVHHAATAIVNAHTGRVALARDDSLEPLGKSWVQRYPTLFVSRASLPPELLAALPPESDLGRLQARVLARYGRRGEEPPDGDLPSAPLDSLAGPERDGAIALPGGGVGWTVPLLDANKHLTGLVVATGGADRRTLWLPAARAGPRWAMIPGRLKATLDSVAMGVTGASARRGGVRAAPFAGGAIFFQSEYAVRPDAAPVLLRTAVLAGGTVMAGRSAAQALGAPGSEDDAAALTPAQFRARAAQLYAQMRAALQRGDWPAFGRAYDALGALLERPPHAP